jgi:hypothetical protein
MMSRWNPSTRQQAINARKRLGGANATPVPPNRVGITSRPKPDVSADRNVPCRKYMACKPHKAHVHRAGNKSVYCGGLQ